MRCQAADWRREVSAELVESLYVWTHLGLREQFCASHFLKCSCKLRTVAYIARHSAICFLSCG